MCFLDFGQIVLIVFFFVIIYMATWIYFRGSVAFCHSNTDLTGKTTLITGANSGIGFYTALDFANRNARVILACRSKERAEQAKEDIIAKSGNKDVVVRIVDLSSMKSVRTFAEKILQEEKRLHILVNNAGATYQNGVKQLSKEGLETLMAANHLGPFLLTNLLLDLLKSSGPSRIVNVSSYAHKFGQIEFDNLQGEKSFQSLQCYSNCKLANILFTRELARKLKGTRVTTNALHPGVVDTNMARDYPFLMKMGSLAVNKCIGKTSEEGAQTSIYLAVSDEVEGVSGKYFSECALDEAGATPVSRDMDLAKKLWEVSAQLTGLVDKTS